MVKVSLQNDQEMLNPGGPAVASVQSPAQAASSVADTGSFFASIGKAADGATDSALDFMFKKKKLEQEQANLLAERGQTSSAYSAMSDLLSEFTSEKYQDMSLPQKELMFNTKAMKLLGSPDFMMMKADDKKALLTETRALLEDASKQQISLTEGGALIYDFLSGKLNYAHNAEAAAAHTLNAAQVKFATENSAQLLSFRDKHTGPDGFFNSEGYAADVREYVSKVSDLHIQDMMMSAQLKKMELTQKGQAIALQRVDLQQKQALTGINDYLGNQIRTFSALMDQFALAKGGNFTQEQAQAHARGLVLSSLGNPDFVRMLTMGGLKLNEVQTSLTTMANQMGDAAYSKSVNAASEYEVKKVEMESKLRQDAFFRSLSPTQQAAATVAKELGPGAAAAPVIAQVFLGKEYDPSSVRLASNLMEKQTDFLTTNWNTAVKNADTASMFTLYQTVSGSLQKLIQDQGTEDDVAAVKAVYRILEDQASNDFFATPEGKKVRGQFVALYGRAMDKLKLNKVDRVNVERDFKAQ